MNTTTVQVRIDPKTKRKAGKIFADLGMDISTGMKVYLNKVVEIEGIPFPVIRRKFLGYPSKGAYKKEVAWALKHGKSYSSAKEMIDAILTERD